MSNVKNSIGLSTSILMPEDNSNDKILVSSICFNIGLLFYKKKNLKYSQKYFEKALKYNPNTRLRVITWMLLRVNLRLNKKKSQPVMRFHSWILKRTISSRI